MAGQYSEKTSHWLTQLLLNPKAKLGVILIGLFAVLAVFGPWVAPYEPLDMVGMPHEAPSAQHWFGTTGQGQDVFSQTIAGARLSLAVGFATGLAVMAIGALLGTAAGYFTGWVHDTINVFINVFLIMPGLPLAVVIAAYLPPGPVTITLVLTITGWAWNARVLRAQTLSLRDKDFVLASRIAGEATWRILLCEILPNMTSLLVSGFIGATVYAIGAQVGLEYLGLGDVSVVTWGTNLYWASNDAALLVGAWWTILPTGLCVALVASGLVFINFAIDEIGNPRLKAENHWAELSPGAARATATPVRRRGAHEPAGRGADP